MEKSKKANECKNNMKVGKKVAKLPRIENVEDQLCDLKNSKNYQTAVLSAEKYAFEKLKNQRISLVGCAFELKLSNYFSNIRT